MSPIGARHIRCVNYLSRGLMTHLQKEAIVSVQSSIAFGDRRQLQPDIALLRLPDDTYENRLPGPADVLAVVEVAYTSRARDRRKARIYGAAGIPETWMVDLQRGVVQVWRDPNPGGYAIVELHRRGAVLAFAKSPELRFEVSEILGKL
jgi:Uma2 family endonuclease